MRLMIYLYY